MNSPNKTFEFKPTSSGNSNKSVPKVHSIFISSSEDEDIDMEAEPLFKQAFAQKKQASNRQPQKTEDEEDTEQVTKPIDKTSFRVIDMTPQGRFEKTKGKVKQS